MPDNKIELAFEQYKAFQENQEKSALKTMEELKKVANRLFSTEDGLYYARQMIRSCRLLDTEPQTLSNEQLRALQAQKDFVNLFITKLVDRKVFINIIEGL